MGWQITGILTDLPRDYSSTQQRKDQNCTLPTLFVGNPPLTHVFPQKRPIIWKNLHAMKWALTQCPPQHNFGSFPWNNLPTHRQNISTMPSGKVLQSSLNLFPCKRNISYFSGRRNSFTNNDCNKDLYRIIDIARMFLWHVDVKWINLSAEYGAGHFCVKYIWTTP